MIQCSKFDKCKTHNCYLCENKELTIEDLKLLILKVYRYAKVLSDRLDVIDPNLEIKPIIIDSFLSNTSENPVQNKIITAALEDISQRIDDMHGEIGDITTEGIKPVYKQIYKQSKSKPITPTGGGYDFSTGILTVPDGWTSKSDFTEKENVWMSYNTFFSDNTSVGWSEPIKLVDYDKIFSDIKQETTDLYDKIIEDTTSDLNNIINNANEEINKAKDAVNEAKDLINSANEKFDNFDAILKEQLDIANNRVNNALIKIDDAKSIADEANKLLNDAKDLLNSFDGDVDGDSDIVTAFGKVTMFADWYDKNAGEIVNLSLELDGINKTISQLAYYIDTNNNKINNVKTTLDAANASIINLASSINETNGSVTEVKNSIDALNGRINETVETINTVRGTVTEVSSTLDSIQGTITTQASNIDTLNNTITSANQEIDGIKGRISSIVENVNTQSGVIVKLMNDIDSANGTIRTLGTKIDDTNKTINNVKSEIDVNTASISQIVESQNNTNGTITTLSNRISAAEDNIQSTGRRIDTVENTVTNYKEEIDLKLGTVKEGIQRVDTETGEVVTIHQEMDAAKGKLNQIAQSVNTNTEKVTALRQEFNTTNGTITTLASNVENTKNIATGVKEQFDAFQASWKVQAEQIADNKISAANLEVTPEKIVSAVTNGDVGAAIIQSINKDVSNIKISADKIILDGDVIAEKISSKRIIINNGASVFEPDGSGHIANGKISWDANGNFALGEGLTFNKDGQITGLKIISFPVGTVMATLLDSNPFNNCWEHQGQINISDTPVNFYRKTSVGTDDWVRTSNLAVFEVTFADIRIPASAKTVSKSDIHISSAKLGNSPIDVNSVNITDKNYYNFSSLGTEETQETSGIIPVNAYYNNYVAFGKLRYTREANVKSIASINKVYDTIPTTSGTNSWIIDSNYRTEGCYIEDGYLYLRYNTYLRTTTNYSFTSGSSYSAVTNVETKYCKISTTGVSIPPKVIGFGFSAIYDGAILAWNTLYRNFEIVNETTIKAKLPTLSEVRADTSLSKYMSTGGVKLIDCRLAQNKDDDKAEMKIFNPDNTLNCTVKSCIFNIEHLNYKYI